MPHSDGMSHALPPSRDALPGFDGSQVDAAGAGGAGRRALGCVAAARPNAGDAVPLLGMGER